MTRKDQTKRLHYDARGREDYNTWDAGAAPRIDRIWDDANRLTRIWNNFSIIDYQYDEAGQVRTEGTTVTGDGVAREVRYCRYPNGEVSQITYPNGSTVVSRFYTPRGQLQGVGWGAGSTSYAYLRDGKVDYQARSNGVTTSYGYDGRGMIESLRHTKDGYDLAKREYWRDDRDRILAWKRGSDTFHNGMEDGRGDRYRYDDEGQLDLASYRVANPENTPGVPLRSDEFHYDALGNRMGSNRVASRGWMDFTRRNNGLNQYLIWSPYSFIYHDDNIPPPSPPDPEFPWVFPGNGVLMQDGWITAGFNALNQPVCIWSPMYPGGPSAQWMWFGYDPLGRCVKRWVGPLAGTPPNQHAPPANSNPATYYYYDGWNLIQEGPSGAADRVYVHGGRMDEIVASWAGGVWSHHQYDARGHCILLTDTSGLIREQYDYDAFGMPYVYNAAGVKVGGAAQWGNRFLFTGREWLKDLKVYDYRNRMYQPELGRFLQPDPQEFAAGDYNLYRYCHNDPVNRSDPMGLVDMQWERQTWLQSGNLLSLAQFDVREQLRAAGKAASEGLRAAFDKLFPENKTPPGSFTRRDLSELTKSWRDDKGTYWVYKKLEYTLLDESGNVPVGSGVRVKEEIAHDQQVDHKEFRLEKGENRTDAQGRVYDHVKIGFSSPKGQVRTTQRLSTPTKTAGHQYTVGYPGWIRWEGEDPHEPVPFK